MPSHHSFCRPIPPYPRIGKIEVATIATMTTITTIAITLFVLLSLKFISINLLSKIYVPFYTFYPPFASCELFYFNRSCLLVQRILLHIVKEHCFPKFGEIFQMRHPA